MHAWSLCLFEYAVNFWIRPWDGAVCLSKERQYVKANSISVWFCSIHALLRTLPGPSQLSILYKILSCLIYFKQCIYHTQHSWFKAVIYSSLYVITDVWALTRGLSCNTHTHTHTHTHYIKTHKYTLTHTYVLTLFLFCLFSALSLSLSVSLSLSPHINPHSLCCRFISSLAPDPGFGWLQLLLFGDGQTVRSGPSSGVGRRGAGCGVRSWRTGTVGV